MTVKQPTAFVFIWGDCLHALLLTAVECERKGQRSQGNEVRRLYEAKTETESLGG